MRHRNGRKKIGRDSSHRKAMLRNMVTSLIRYDQLETTDAKAKEVRPVVEKMITLAKRGDLHARRQALSYIRDKAITHRLFEELKDRYLDRQGGYTRVIKKGIRKGDGAPLSVIQLLPAEEGKKKAKEKGKSGQSPSKKEPKVKKEEKQKETGKVQTESRMETRGRCRVKGPASSSLAKLKWPEKARQRG